MKRKGIVWTMFGLFIALSSAYADGSPEGFYKKCIDVEIQHCRIKAERVDSRSANIREDAERAEDQADYFEINRDILAQQMEQERIRKKEHRVHRYLLDSYRESLLARD